MSTSVLAVEPEAAGEHKAALAARFLIECCNLSTTGDFRSDLYEDFKTWCRAQGEVCSDTIWMSGSFLLELRKQSGDEAYAAISGRRGMFHYGVQHKSRGGTESLSAKTAAAVAARRASAASLTSCAVCGVPDREESTLMCEDCDAEYHIECLTPPLAAVPEGDWLCPRCDKRAAARKTKAKKSRQQPRPAPSPDESDDEEEEHISKNEKLLLQRSERKALAARKKMLTAQFLRELCDVTENEEHQEFKTDLYDEFYKWCKDKGEACSPKLVRGYVGDGFQVELRERCGGPTMHLGRPTYSGVRLRSRGADYSPAEAAAAEKRAQRNENARKIELTPEFLAECCITTGEASDEELKSVLYGEFRKWMLARGEICSDKPMRGGVDGFDRQMRDTCGHPFSNLAGARCYSGVRLKSRGASVRLPADEPQIGEDEIRKREKREKVLKDRSDRKAESAHKRALTIQFLDECCEVTDNEEHQEFKSDLYQAFYTWCKEKGEPCNSKLVRGFVGDGFQVELRLRCGSPKMHLGKPTYTGVRLKSRGADYSPAEAAATEKRAQKTENARKIALTPEFMAECCDLTEGEGYEVLKSVLYAEFHKWMLARGETCSIAPLQGGVDGFDKKMRIACGPPFSNSFGARCYAGVRLKNRSVSELTSEEKQLAENARRRQHALTQAKQKTVLAAQFMDEVCDFTSSEERETKYALVQAFTQWCEQGGKTCIPEMQGQSGRDPFELVLKKKCGLPQYTKRGEAVNGERGSYYCGVRLNDRDASQPSAAGAGSSSAVAGQKRGPGKSPHGGRRVRTRT